MKSKFVLSQHYSNLNSKTDNFKNAARSQHVEGQCNLRLSPRGADGRRTGSFGQSPFMDMVLQQAPNSIIVCDTQGKITLVNAAARQLAQVNPEGRLLDCAPNIWGELFDLNGCYLPAQEWPCMRALHGETTNGKQYHLKQTGGSSYDLLFSAVPIRTADKNIAGAMATLTDITQYRQAERMQRQETVWKERRRMAADLHDTLSQGLNAIVLQLQAAEQDFAENIDEARRHLRHARDVARASLAHARSSMWTLTDESLEGQELGPALSSLAKQFFIATPVKLEFSFQKQARTLSPEIRLELLRIGKEALANVQKHAQATTVRIQLVYKHRKIQLCVDDDGRGFVRAPISGIRRSFGLSSMHERAQRLGGKAVVKSQPGRGTRVLALVPLPADFVQRVAA